MWNTSIHASRTLLRTSLLALCALPTHGQTGCIRRPNRGIWRCCGGPERFEYKPGSAQWAKGVVPLQAGMACAFGELFPAKWNVLARG